MAGHDLDFAVKLNDVDFGFKSGELVLKHVSVNIPHGGIYAILGPSGCGKTTLLKVLSRLIPPDKGTVEFSYKDYETRPIPGNGIGYVPQEMGLIEELSIEENLRLFASLNGVGDDYQERKRNLMELFSLLDVGATLVGDMSGGEKRRLSLVVALLHRPPVVVLDEPTVGIDPLMRKTIWEYLAKLTEDGITVIITTHYVDEAKDADWICFVRNGRVISETTPESLQEHYEETHFETCYTNLFEDDEAGRDLPNTKLKPKKEFVAREQSAPLITSKSSFKTDLSRLKALTIRNLHFVRRNVAAVFFLIVISIVQPLLFTTIVGSPLSALKIALANEESPKFLSTQYLKELDNHALWIDNYTDSKGAIDSVRDGSHWGAIHIGSNFTRCLFRRFRDGLKVSNSTIDCSTIKVYMDNTNSIIFNTVADKLYSAMNKFSKDMLVTVGSNPIIAESPLHFEDPPVYGRFNISMTEYILPNILVCLIFMLGTMATALCLVSEKQSGAIHRLLVTGATRTQLLLSQFLCQMVITLVQVVVMLFVPYVAFSIPMEGSALLSIFNLVFLNICANSFGLFISSIADTFYAVINLLNAFLYPGSFLSGLLWPLEGMPYFLRYPAYFIPMTMQMESLRCVIGRGWGLGHLPVFLGFLSSVVWTIIFLVLSILVFKIRK